MNDSSVKELNDFLSTLTRLNDKSQVAKAVSKKFSLIKDRSVYFCDDFSIRFSSSSSENFSNTVLSLSALQKYDSKPFFVCLITPKGISMFLANSTLLKKVSHSSQKFRTNNIKGSFNGSDIMRSLAGVENNAQHLMKLFAIHESIGFDGNLERLVEATNNISPSGKPFNPTKEEKAVILKAPERASSFVSSDDFAILKRELDEKVEQFKEQIIIASLIENVNVRGRVIEYLIAGKDDELREQIIEVLRGKGGGLPPFKTDNSLGDYSRDFVDFATETDVKTKIMVLHSNPKAYNLDKALQFLSHDRSVFMFYFVGIDLTRIVNTVLISMFQKELLDSTILLKHWAGRNSRGVSQFDGHTIQELIFVPNSDIDLGRATAFLNELLAMTGSVPKVDPS